MDYDALIRNLRSSAKAFRENSVYDSEGDPVRLIVQADEADRAADAIATLRARNEALVEALSKITPIVVHDGRDYAEVAFSDGRTHSSQAMTMNPQDWLDIQAAYDAALAANREG